MEVATLCIIHEGIAQKLGKCSYTESKEASRQGMHLNIFMYFPAANFWQGANNKNGSWNKILSIKASYSFLTFFFQILNFRNNF